MTPNEFSQLHDDLVMWIESNNLKERIGIKGNTITWIFAQTNRKKAEMVKRGKFHIKVRGTSIEELSKKWKFGNTENGEYLRKKLLQIARFKGFV